MKKALKKKQNDDQYRSLQKNSELMHKEQQLNLNAQLEDVFQS